MTPTPAAGRASAPQPSPDQPPTPAPPPSRRLLLAGLIGAAGAAAAACNGLDAIPSARSEAAGSSGAAGGAAAGTVELPTGARPVPRSLVATMPKAGSLFPDRDASYALSGPRPRWRWRRRPRPGAPGTTTAPTTTTPATTTPTTAPTTTTPSPTTAPTSTTTSAPASTSAPTTTAPTTKPTATTAPATTAPTSTVAPTTTALPTTAPTTTAPTTTAPTTTTAPPPPDPPAGQFQGAAAAAAATTVTSETILATDQPSLHLLRRATFGPTTTDVADIARMGIDGWLAAQLNPASIDDGVADGVWRRFPLASMSAAQLQTATERYGWDAMMAYAQATLTRQVWSRRQLYEVMVDLWANHLNVTIPSDGAWDVGPSYHNDVIRKNALGSFTDMLLAAMRHPAMLRYLNNNESTKDSVNENLGRELLELHTVGVDAGYTETDVRNSAYILSGRTDTEDGAFKYDNWRHWTGPVTVLTFTSANGTAAGGLDVGDAYLRYLASHPSTARRLARKIAVRFVSDTPPASLIDRMAKAYLDSGTQIKPMLETLFRSSEFWALPGQKTRRPLENTVASMRALGIQPGSDPVKGIQGIYWELGSIGQQPLGWVPPNGYPDVAAAWNSAGGTLNTWNLHRGLVQGWWAGLGYTKPEALVPTTTGTVGDYLDRLCEKLAQQRFGAQHKGALLAFLGTTADKPIAGSPVASMAPHLTPLVLDSAYLALR